jgi:hypothetical protein
MDRDRPKKDLLGFMDAAVTEETLASEFFSLSIHKSPGESKQLHDFFYRNGFTEISKEDCERIIAFVNRKGLPTLSPGDLRKCY